MLDIQNKFKPTKDLFETIQSPNFSFPQSAIPEQLAHQAVHVRLQVDLDIHSNPSQPNLTHISLSPPEMSKTWNGSPWLCSVSPELLSSN